MAVTKTNSIMEVPVSIPTLPTPEPIRPVLKKSQTVLSDALSTTSTVVPEHDAEPFKFDIEHMPVNNDPRAWSPLRKNVSLVLIAGASMVAALAANIQNPAVETMEADLHATPSQFSLSISIFILTQGLFPLIWSAISEVKGRKLVYILSLSLFTLGSIIVALSQRIAPVIGFRALQAAGSSAVSAIGSASLADIFEPAERGTKMGLYYIAPLLGPAMGPIFGGILTSVWGWRSIFWFLAIICGTTLVSFILFFQDTFRCERSLTYQRLLKQRLRSTASLPLSYPNRPATFMRKNSIQALKANADIEKTTAQGGTQDITQSTDMPVITLSFRDVNPFHPIAHVVRRPNNLLILLSSGLLYAFGFVVLYATSRTLADSYNYDPLKIGLISIAYGAGSVAGSILGGRWSDRALQKLRTQQGRSYPEMRLKSTIYGIAVLPPTVVALGWVYHFHLHIAVVCLFLFLGGFFNIWIYSSSLAYVVDANNGRASTASACNSAFRGLFAFISTEIAVPLQDGLGDGWMYTVWAGIVLLGGVCILIVSWKGEDWRLAAEMREAAYDKSLDDVAISTAAT
ncbi:hypothetical protein D9619_007469 [Psilocybe cf. subviscida]|uniref:Major facilitator superfamily (MFS) profile domain-containing protein n=1 Tax=Psilocybe cf. subviscida TaxID=2480587 RepID=A0A8H5B445_9AGAR|nr:hypothetical protein D9619_007469 [Psilocybe cf. subviscida]